MMRFFNGGRLHVVGGALVLSMATLLMTGCGQTSQSASALIELSRAKLEAGEFDAARLSAKEALQLEPDNPQGRLLSALLHLEVGQGRAAEIDLDKAERLGLTTIDTVVPRVKALMLQDKFDEVLAIDITDSMPASIQAELLAAHATAKVGKDDVEGAMGLFDAALAKDPQNAAALTGKAFQLLKADKFEEGRSLALDATRANPRFAPAWSLLGDAESYAGNYDAAEAAYSKAIDTRALAPVDLVSRALVRLAKEDKAGAEADIERLKRQRFNIPHGAYVRGIMLLQEKKHAEALTQFNEVLAKHPNYVKAKCYAGMSALALGNLQRAGDEFKVCLRHYPYADDMRRSYAAVQLALGDEKAGLETLRPLTSREQPEPEALKLMAQYEQFRGNKDRALEYVQALVASDADNPERLVQLGLSLSAAGREEEAQSAFDRAKEIEPDLKEADLIEAQAMLAAGRTDDAIAQLNTARSARPRDPQVLNMLSLAQQRKGDGAEALKLLEEAVAIDPGYSYAALNLAKLKREAGEQEAAASLIDGVLEREPDHVRALGMAVALDVELGRADQARTRIEKAQARLKEPDEHVLLIAARFEASQNNPARAAAHYDELIKRFGRRAEWLRELGRAQLANGQSEQAIKTLDDVITLSDRPAADWIQLARAQESIGDNAGAANSIQQALASEPDNPAARLAEIRQLIGKGATDDAARRLDELKKMAPVQDIPELLAAEGYLRLRLGRREEGLERFQRAFEADPSPSRVVELARVQASNGDAQGALATLGKWVAEHPEDDGVNFVLADAYAKTGDVDRARQVYEAMLERNPDNALVFNNLAWMLRDIDTPAALGYARRAAKAAPRSPAILDTLGVLELRAGDSGRAVAALRDAAEAQKQSPVIALHLAEALIADDAMGEAQRVLRSIRDEELVDGDDRKRYAKLKSDLGMN